MQTATLNTESTGETTRETTMRAARRMAVADCCRLFAACFYPPDKQMLSGESVSEKLGASLQKACPCSAPLMPPLSKYLQEDDADALAVAYTQLFLGPVELLAPPYASWYLDKSGRVMGPSSVAMEKLYQRAGLAIDGDFTETPDHVAVVLEFVYYLLFRETVAESIGNPDEKQEMLDIRETFLQNYILPWIPEFCERIRSADRHPFYTGLARCLDAFLRCVFTDEIRNKENP